MMKFPLVLSILPLLLVGGLVSCSTPSGTPGYRAPNFGPASRSQLTLEELSTQRYARELRVMIGQREQNDDSWEPNATQDVLGVEFELRNLSTGVSFEAGYMKADSDETQAIGGGPSVASLSAEVGEIYLGVRKSFNESESFRPYLGTGISLQVADIDVAPVGAAVSGRDEGTGIYVRAGGVWYFGRFHTGFDLRALFLSELDFNIDDLDGDYLQAAWVFGFSL